MPRAKISEFSTIPGDNTDIDGINIAEGCAPSGINDAIRELMAQLKDFQSGAAGDNITVVGTLAAKGTSSSGADLKLYEDTDNGTNYVGFIAPASIASNVQWTLPSADGSSGQALQTNGSGTLSFATLGISAGGTGQTTANAAFNALVPSQTSNAGRYLKTDGTNTSWDLLDISTADITGTLPVANGGTGLTSFTANRVFYASSTSAIGSSANLTFDGTTLTANALTTSSTVTINGGTANGVAYLNGSKVLTTGSALTYNGTLLTIKGGNASTLQVDNGGQQYTELDFANNGVVKAPIYWDNTASNFYIGSSGQMQFAAAGGNPFIWTISTEQMRLTSTGLGIGTSSPATKLDVNGSINLSSVGNLTWGGAYGAGIPTIAVPSAGSLGFYPNGSTSGLSMVLNSSGNLGIGTSSPATRLDVALAAVTPSNTSFHGIVVGPDSGTTSLGQAVGIGFRLRNTAGGGVGGNGLGAAVYGIQADTGANTGSLAFYTRPDAASLAERARITSGGDLLVGTTSFAPGSTEGVILGSSRRLFVTKSGDAPGYFNRIGDTGILIELATGGTVRGNISSNGSTVSYNTSSDYRLKDNPQPLTGSGAFIDALKPKTWAWKSDGSKGVGFIAHEVQEVSPGSVVGEKDAVDADGKPVHQAMEYGSAEFIANIIAELQSLRARVAALEAK